MYSLSLSWKKYLQRRSAYIQSFMSLIPYTNLYKSLVKFRILIPISIRSPAKPVNSTYLKVVCKTKYTAAPHNKTLQCILNFDLSTL